MGDWNFVDDVDADRCWQGARPNGDAPSAQALVAATGGALRDAFRVCHPTARRFTCFTRGSATHHASRLDCAYISLGLVPFVLNCTVVPCPISDHQLVVLQLRARAPPERGPGLRRMRMDFRCHQQSRDGFVAWLQAQVQSAPADAATLLQWWPAFKR